MEENKEDRVSKRFDIKRLFEAVSTGDVMKLEGLHQYLHQSMKKLSNTECEGDYALQYIVLYNCSILGYHFTLQCYYCCVTTRVITV